ncbi:MAG: hypothetical protein ACOX7J_08985 [Bacillota bacterium]
MADILVMDTRSYIELDHGNNMCGTLTLVLFMLYCCQDPMILLNEIQDMFEDAESNVS